LSDDTRTERQKTIDRLLMLYVIKTMNEAGIEVTEESLMTRIFIIQQYMNTQGIETFSYNDWNWVDEVSE